MPACYQVEISRRDLGQDGSSGFYPHFIAISFLTRRVCLKYFAAIQSLLSPEKTETFRQAHLDFLNKMVADGHIYARGRFPDGSGGLTIFQAETLEDAKKLAESDPYVHGGVRRVEIREWAMKIGN